MGEDIRLTAEIAIKQKHSPAREQVVASSIIMLSFLLIEFPFWPADSEGVCPTDTGPVGTDPVGTGLGDRGLRLGLTVTVVLLTLVRASNLKLAGQAG
jgi:hypothetical protein